VSAGGWHAVQEMSADPKAELVSMIASSLKDAKGSVGKVPDAGKFEALAGLLESRGKGFDADLVDGEWAAVFFKQGKQSPKVQKLVGKTEKAKKAFSNFNIKDMKFSNINYTPRGNGRLQADLVVSNGGVLNNIQITSFSNHQSLLHSQYKPTSEAFSKSVDGKIVLRRVKCKITNVNYKYRRLPKLPIPLSGKEGFLDFLYLDDDIRVTRGNRGGLFVHFRPEFLESAMN